MATLSDRQFKHIERRIDEMLHEKINKRSTEMLGALGAQLVSPEEIFNAIRDGKATFRKDNRDRIRGLISPENLDWPEYDAREEEYNRNSIEFHSYMRSIQAAAEEVKDKIILGDAEFALAALAEFAKL